MLIVCPKCFTQYLISDEIKLSKNQKFHCSSCHNYFTQETENVRESSINSVGETVNKQNKAGGLEAQKALGKETAFLSASTESESSKAPSDSLFSKPLGLLDEERPSKEDRLDSVPDEFKPVNPPKKTSFGAALIWLVIAAGICVAAYSQKDFLIAQIDSLIMDQLTAKKPNATPKQPVVNPQLPTAVSTPVSVEQINETALPGMNEQKKEFLPKQVGESASVMSEKPNVLSEGANPAMPLKDVLKVQDVSYAIGPNEVGVERLLIQGNVANTELREVDLPELKAVVYDEQDNVVARKRIVFSQKKLAGNTAQSFTAAVVPAPQTVSRVEVVFDE